MQEPAQSFDVLNYLSCAYGEILARRTAASAQLLLDEHIRILGNLQARCDIDDGLPISVLGARSAIAAFLLEGGAPVAEVATVPWIASSEPLSPSSALEAVRFVLAQKNCPWAIERRYLPPETAFGIDARRAFLWGFQCQMLGAALTERYDFPSEAGAGRDDTDYRRASYMGVGDTFKIEIDDTLSSTRMFAHASHHLVLAEALSHIPAPHRRPVARAMIRFVAAVESSGFVSDFASLIKLAAIACG